MRADTGVGPAIASGNQVYNGIYVSKKSVPSRDSEVSGIQKVIYNKYYVDEIYDTIFVNQSTHYQSFSVQ